MAVSEKIYMEYRNLSSGQVLCQWTSEDYQKSTQHLMDFNRLLINL